MFVRGTKLIFPSLLGVQNQHSHPSKTLTAVKLNAPNTIILFQSDRIYWEIYLLTETRINFSSVKVL
jgi:hypothetical protein